MAGWKKEADETRLLQIIIGVITALISLSAIWGCLALLFGTSQSGEAGGRASFPLAWLQDTPFGDYTVPALILGLAVGGSSLLATFLLFTGRAKGALAACVAGLLMAGYIIGEVSLLRQGFSWIEGVYFGLGLLIFALGAALRAMEHPGQPVLSSRD